MFPYYVLIIAPLLLCLLEFAGVFGKNTVPAGPSALGDSTELKKRGLSLFFLIFIVLLSLRGIRCGIDLKNYNYDFERFAQTEWSDIFAGSALSSEKEIGYRLLNKIVLVFTDNFQVFVAIVAMISVIPLWVLYRKDSEGEALTIVLFLALAPFSMYFSGLRQVIAMAFAVPALYFTKKKKIVPFLICVALAFTFHFSALILAVLYPLYRAKITKNWLYAVVPAMALVFIFRRYIFGFLLRFLEDTRYESYTVSETGAYGMLILFILIAAVTVLFTYDNAENLSADDIGYRNILLLIAVLQCFAPLSTIAMRMNYYFLIFLPIAVPRLLRKSGPRFMQISKISYAVLFVFFLARFIILMYTGTNQLQIFPYIPFWENV